jgi:hypothetical protein
MRSFAFLGVLPALLFASGCRPGPSPPGAAPAPGPIGSVTFLEVAERAGVRFRNVCGGKDKDYVLEVNGAGCSIFDYDNDGDLDIFLVNGGRLEPPYGPPPPPGPPPSDALFRNDGAMKFTDVTRAAGLVESAWGCGSAAADYDNDGWTDLFVANYGPDTLWHNNGNGTFSDVTAAAGAGDPAWGASCAWLDYDGDGLLDLVVVNYLEFDPKKVKRRGTDLTCQYKGQLILCGPVGLPPAYPTLYHQKSDHTFADVSVSSGLRSAPPSYGLGVVALDYNNDGRPDIYITNDTRPNLLFENRGDGTFVEVGMRAGVALNELGQVQAGMGVDATFRSGSGFEDLFVVNYEDDANNYRKNEGNGFFSEITVPLGLAAPCFKYLGWSCFFFDADLDGEEDLFVAQGHVVPQADQIASSPGYRQPNKLFLGDRSGKFIDASSSAGPAFELKRSSRGAAYGDLDGDGDLDIVVNVIDDQAMLLENAGPPRGHWLSVRTSGTVSNRDGIGAVVSILSGGRSQMRRIRSGSSYASSSQIAAHFGLGQATGVDELRVRWPTGKEESYPVPGVDRRITVTEGKGTPAPPRTTSGIR